MSKQLNEKVEEGMMKLGEAYSLAVREKKKDISLRLKGIHDLADLVLEDLEKGEEGE